MNKLRRIEKISRNLKYYKNMIGNTTMSANTYEVLRIIVKHPCITSKELSDRIDLDKGLVSRIVSSLIKEKYITTDVNKEDKRQKLLLPTEKTIELKDSNEKLDDKFYTYLSTLITEEEETKFYEIIEKIYKESKRLRHDKFKDLK